MIPTATGERHIYVLRDPRTARVYYVGQTFNLRARYGSHKPTRMEVLETVPECDALSAEARWIDYFRSRGELLRNARRPSRTPAVESVEFRPFDRAAYERGVSRRTS